MIIKMINLTVSVLLFINFLVIKIQIMIDCLKKIKTQSNF